MNILSKIRIPEFCMSHWLLRIPLAIIFIQQGLMKIPVDIEEAASYGLSYLVWWFVAYGELLGGLGLVVGGFLNKTPATMEQIFGVNPWLYPFPIFCGSGKPKGDGIYWATVQS